ncbi:MAG: DUF1330 domain-containing protein [Gammaproteobacteria bacterium]|nr:DUF1330 domain-containing protein [Gammaproteobacteria bacterium]
MHPAYLIADISLHNVERYQDYIDNVPDLIKRHGGRYQVRGGNVDILEGSYSPSRLVVLEFPDRAAALAFYNDPDYRPYKHLRQSISDGTLVLVDGC